VHLTFLIASGTQTKNNKPKKGEFGGWKAVCKPRNLLATVFAGISDFELHEFNLCVTYVSFFCRSRLFIVCRVEIKASESTELNFGDWPAYMAYAQRD